MKNLKDFILESQSTSTTITFNFSKFNDSKDVLDSLKEMDNVSVSENSVTVTVTKSNYDKLDSIVDILQQYGEKIAKGQDSTTYENIAQAAKTFNQNVAKLNDAIDEFENPEDESKSDDESKDDDSKDKDESKDDDKSDSKDKKDNEE